MNLLFKKKQNNENQKRFVVIHNHVFKNAGSTIDWALLKNFGSDFVDHRDDQKMLKEPDYLATYLLENSNIRALSSHHLRLPLPLLDNVELMTIMMFRHPIERVTSVYNFERKQIQANTLGARFARDHNLREYVLWRMSFNVPPTIRNFHIFRSLPSPVRWQEEVGTAELNKAKTYVNSSEMIGFVDRFDESMVIFEKFLGAVFPKIDLTYKMQNVSQHRREPLEFRIDRLRKETGDDVFNLLIDRNRADLDLFDYARGVFEERLNRIKDFDANLDDFRKRCRRKFEI